MSGVELFMQDVELMNVIILSDVGPSSVKNEEDKHNSKLTVSSTTSQVNTWGSTTVGQCAIIMEFIWIIRELRLQQSSDVCNFMIIFNFDYIDSYSANLKL
jgi:hypothetical protein